MTADPVGNIKAIEKLIPRNAQIMQTVQTQTLKQSMESSEATLLQVRQSVRPGASQYVNVNA